MTKPVPSPEDRSLTADGTSRRSRSRRSQRPATDGIPEGERELVTEVEELAEAAPATDGPGGARTSASKRSARSPGAGSDDWWQEQRPPHWS